LRGNIKGLEHYIWLCVGNRKNNFVINFVNSNFNLWKNITFYRIPDKINGEYLINTLGCSPELLIAEAKQLVLYRFRVNNNNKMLNRWIKGNLMVKDSTGL
jgi:hypothetical protein